MTGEFWIVATAFLAGLLVGEFAHLTYEIYQYRKARRRITELEDQTAEYRATIDRLRANWPK